MVSTRQKNIRDLMTFTPQNKSKKAENPITLLLPVVLCLADFTADYHDIRTL